MYSYKRWRLGDKKYKRQRFAKVLARRGNLVDPHSPAQRRFKKEDKGGWLRHLTQHSLSLEDKRLRTIQREVRMLKLTWRSFLSLPYHPMSCFVPFQFPFAFPCLQIFLNFWILYQIHVLFSVCLFYWWTRSDCFISPVSDLGWLYLIAQLNWFSIVFIRPVPDQGWLNLCIRWVRSIAHSWKCLIC